MTAIVGVLNKRAVAIAADSAVTLGNTHKVLNTGNKLFTLSKYAPVGIAIYGTASLMDTPWEVIIKHYKRKLGSKKFLYMKEYAMDFINFLKGHEFFTPESCQKLYLQLQMQSFYDIVEKNAQANSLFKTNQTQAILDDLNSCLQANKTSSDVFDDFQDFDLLQFKNYATNEIDKVFQSKPYLTTQAHKDVFIESYYHYMRIKSIPRNLESGLVFFGYGEEEIYPCIYEVLTTIGFQGRLQYWFRESTEIKNDGVPASIIPFAQINVTQTIIRGINPTFYDILSKTFSDSMIAFRSQISGLVRKVKGMEKLADGIDNLDPTPSANAFTQNSQSQFRLNYTMPLVNTINNMGIEDMANVAESFVSLTSLVRRMSPGEETVGGPVDVAVVSKGDGFIWIKRKHYFKPELNSQFFSNYYNE